MFYVTVLGSAVLVEALLDCGSVEAARDRFESVRDLVVAERRAPGAWTWLAKAGTLLAPDSGEAAARPAGATRLRSPADVVEGLTEREVDMARFLSSRLTVREIAQGSI
jgi:hypothetical protein